MANEEQVELLKTSVAKWNEWRKKNPDIDPDLSRADLFRVDLGGADLHHADLHQAVLQESNLHGANLRGADLNHSDLRFAELSDADLCGANLIEADLSVAKLPAANLRGADLNTAFLCSAVLLQADLHGANLRGANLAHADLRGADLREAELRYASLVRTNLKNADLTGCQIFGVSVWSIEIDESTKQSGLIITQVDEPIVMVDDLEVAQFIYLLLNREKIRNVIDTVTRKGVLILGRFGDGGLDMLQAIAEWLRSPEHGGYLPLLFDFPRPESKTYTETVRTLAGLARFVIVDLSGPSVPQEITATVDVHEIPFIPILEEERSDWSMFHDFLVKERVLDPIRFSNQGHLLECLSDQGIKPAEKLIEKRQRRLDKIFGRT